MNQVILYPEAGKLSKIVTIQDGAVKTLGKPFDYEKLGAYASNSTVTRDYLAGFVASQQSYEFERDCLDEYPDWQERIVVLKQRTQAFMHSAINSRAKLTSTTGRAIEREMGMKAFPRRFRKMLTIHTSRSVKTNSDFENLNIAHENVSIRFVCNRIVFNVYYRSFSWEARADGALISLTNANLSDLLHGCEHLALYNEVL